MKCCVKGCKNLVRFQFPRDQEYQRRWLEAIRRPNYVPRRKNGLCLDHFEPEFIVTESHYKGIKLERLRLKKDAVPTLFDWDPQQSDKIVNSRCSCSSGGAGKVNKQPNDKSRKITKNTPVILCRSFLQKVGSDRCERVLSLDERVILEKLDVGASSDLPISAVRTNDCSSAKVEFIFGQEIDNYDDAYAQQVELYEEIVSNGKKSYNDCLVVHDEMKIVDHQDHNYCTKPKILDQSTQTSSRGRYRIEDMLKDPRGLFQFTGLENPLKFTNVFSSLSSKAHDLQSRDQDVGDLSLKDQLFLTLWKLRKYPSDCELSRHFGVSEKAVDNIFQTWIPFMASQWSKTDIWPSEQLSQIIKKDTKITNSNIKLQQLINKMKYYRILSKKVKRHISQIKEITGICATLCVFNNHKLFS
ncbi:hypothetical protein TKK_0007527 [Trichogramma kaykai]|uniref:THAP-type domain-containing protein n=1 Tax=Trichogramma kaykai TaxID=54128 RepID=A0ABD2WFW7_9HYME